MEDLAGHPPRVAAEWAVGRAELAALAHPEAAAGPGPVVAALVAPADPSTDAGGEGERFALVLRGGDGGGCAEV